MRDTLDSQVSPDMQGIWNLEFKSTDDGFSIDDPALFTAIEEINQFIKSVIGEDDSWSDHEFISPKGVNITFKVKTVSIGER